jgi:hypothetical protein
MPRYFQCISPPPLAIYYLRKIMAGARLSPSQAERSRVSLCFGLLRAYPHGGRVIHTHHVYQSLPRFPLYGVHTLITQNVNHAYSLTHLCCRCRAMRR